MTGRKSKEKIRLTDGEKKGNTWYRGLCVIFPGRKSIWTFHNGYMTKLIMREPGMIWSMERDMLLIIIMNR